MICISQGIAVTLSGVVDRIKITDVKFLLHPVYQKSLELADFRLHYLKKYKIDVSGTQCMLKQVSVNVDTSPRTGHSCDVRIN